MQIRQLTILIALFLTVLSGPLLAASIPNSPGWKLEPVEKSDQAAEPQENGEIEYSTYFALYPNDKRPPITIDGTTAQRLFAGQLTAEGVYYDRTAGAAAAAAKKAQENAGGGATGWQMAESTYVPLAEGGAKNPNATNSSSLLSAMPNGGASGTSAGGAGGPGGANGAGGASGATGMAAAGQFALPNAGGGSGGGASGGGGSTTFGSGGTAVKPAATAATAFTGDAGAAAASNLTYSQQIDAAMKQATTSACGRMGSYAQGGYCNK